MKKENVGHVLFLSGFAVLVVGLSLAWLPLGVVAFGAYLIVLGKDWGKEK